MDEFLLLIDFIYEVALDVR